MPYMTDKITVGDIVHIKYCKDDEDINCTVLYIPCESDECWILKNRWSEIIYVKNFEKIRKDVRNN